MGYHVKAIASFLLIILNSQSECARILCVYPMPSFSHQSVFKMYTQELLRLGHQLVVLTPQPSLPKHRPPDNLTEIDVGTVSDEIFLNMMRTLKSKGLLKRGVILDLEAYLDDSVIDVYTKLNAEQFKHPDFVKLMKDPKQHFDLIVIEALMEYPLILSDIYKAPVILLSSFYGYPRNFDLMGSFRANMFLYPQFLLNNFGSVSIWEKFNQIYDEWKLMTFHAKVKEVGDHLIKTDFGPDAPVIDDLKNNVAMVLLNVHPIFDGNRPVPPSIQYLGALHIKPANRLPQDLKAYLDASKDGVIYVSLGTMVDPNQMEKEFVDQFVEAFKKLPYNILWKWDIEHLEAIPKNVRIEEWLPQRDLLMHPNIKLFVTQGGLHSIDEAINAGVPIVGIPFLIDQWYNVHKSEQLGIGLKLNSAKVTADDIIKAVTSVIANESFKSNVLKLRTIMQDQPETPLQRAIWWTDHVLRHGGARHLRAAGANISWPEFFMLDVLLPLFFLFLILVFIVVKLARILILSVYYYSLYFKQKQE